MGLGVLLALFSLALLGTAFIDSGGSGGSEDDEPSNPDLEIDDEGNLYGTQGDDVITFDDIVEADNPSGILAGAGDDVVDLRVPENWADENPDLNVNEYLGLSVVDLGSGNDFFAPPRGVTDTGAQIFGGEGDDTILAPSAFETEIFGGEGNDTIDVIGSTSTTVEGGDGDDYISTPWGHPSGFGSTAFAYGGEGDDTLHVFALTEFEERADYSGRILGGAGTDHFIVELNEGPEFDADLGSLSDFNADFEFLENEDGTALRSTALALPDFHPQTETLQLNLTPEGDQFEVGSVHMEADGIVVTYIPLEYQDELLPREIAIRMDTTGLTWDQITLVGADNAVLSPVAA